MREGSVSSYGDSRKGRLESLRSQLEQDREAFMSLWRDIATYIMPWAGKFLWNQRFSRRLNRQIVDNTATVAARNWSSGLMGGGSSAVRPWFRLTIADQDRAEFGPVKTWLHRITDLMQLQFLKSNTYQALPVHYEDMGVFCTSAMLTLDDAKDVKRFYNLPIGSYALGAGARGIVEVMTRTTHMTVRQIVERWGKPDANSEEGKWGGISDTTRKLWDESKYEEPVKIIHVIEPNTDYDRDRAHPKYKKFYECYYEEGSDEDLFLDERGYDLFPVLATRVKTNGEDVYGVGGPGIDCIGDVRALQTYHRKLATAIAKKVEPPMVGPAALRGRESNLEPGGKTYLDERDMQQGFRPAYQVQFETREVGEQIADHRQRINTAFMNDIFLMLAMSDRRQITAREVEERHEEKYFMLGPLLERLNDDLYEPMIDLMFDGMLDRGLIPKPPPDLPAGTPLKVEYLSIMGQAQKAVGAAGLERLVSFAASIAAGSGNPRVWNKLDEYQLIDEYADMTGLPPQVIRADEQVQAMDQAQQQAAQAAAQQQQMMATAQIAKDAGSVDLTTDNPVTRGLRLAGAA